MAVSVVDPQSIIYKRAAEALAVSVVDPQSDIYKRAAGESEAFAAAPLFTYLQSVGESQHAALISPLPIPSYFPPTERF
ncbi:hypothetical protein DJ72_07690 [Halorubrum distributum]|nr:hypothetical protein DJ72_07690 [Halorubrum distributum]